MHLSFQIKYNNLQDFINHWSSKYRYSHEQKYDNNIQKPFTLHSRLELFEWKNGSTISARKLKSIEENYPLNFKGDHEQRYLNHKENGGAIWNIFYLHCLKPQIWPIYDQHTYRAMKYIQHGNIVELGNNYQKIYESYKKEYIPFFQNLNTSENFKERELDKALFAFGQFLKKAHRYI